MDQFSPPEESESPSAPRIRLQRFLAACGLGSRRACEQLILDGRISIDGETASELGATVDPSTQKIAYDGERLKMERKRYYLLNKPPGFLCTNWDPANRRKAIDLLPSEGPRLFTVGRLDEHSTGVLVVTNDGDLAEKMAHPRNQIFRTYHIQVAGHPSREIYESLKEGLHFSEGRFSVRTVKALKRIGQSTWLEVVLSEGHNRELRRLFARVGHKVLKLTRVSFGPIRLGRLGMGEYRDLSVRELEELHALIARETEGAPKRKPQRRKTGFGKRPAKRKFSGKGPAKATGRTPTKSAAPKSTMRKSTATKSTATKSTATKTGGPARRPSASKRGPSKRPRR